MKLFVSIFTLLLIFSPSRSDILPPDVHYLRHSLIFTNINDFSGITFFRKCTNNNGRMSYGICNIIISNVSVSGCSNVDTSNCYSAIYYCLTDSCQCQISGNIKIADLPSGNILVSDSNPMVSILSEYVLYYDSTATIRTAIQKRTVKFNNGKADSVITYPKPSAIEMSTVSKNLKQPTVKYANGFIDYTLPSNEPSTLTFWNPAGKKVAFVRVNNISGRVLVPALASGNYLAVLESQKFKVSTKLVVKH